MLEIKPTLGLTNFSPQSEISGTVSWILENNPKNILINLIWYTEGKGTVDHRLVEQYEHKTTAKSGETAFSFQLPYGPYSLSGKLISIIWAVEVLAEPKIEHTKLEIIVSPYEQELELYQGQT